MGNNSQYLNELKTCHNLLLLNFQKPGQQVKKSFSAEKTSCKESSSLAASTDRSSLTSCRRKKSDGMSERVAKSNPRSQQGRDVILRQPRPTGTTKDIEVRLSCENIQSLPTAAAKKGNIGPSDPLPKRQLKASQIPRRKPAKDISQDPVRNNEIVGPTGVRSTNPKRPPSKMAPSHAKTDPQPRARLARFGLSFKILRHEAVRVTLSQSESLDTPGEGGNSGSQSISKPRVSTVSTGQKEKVTPRLTNFKALANRFKKKERTYISELVKQTCAERKATKMCNGTALESNFNQQTSPSRVSRGFTPDSKLLPNRSSLFNVISEKVTSCENTHLMCSPPSEPNVNTPGILLKETCQSSTDLKRTSRGSEKSEGAQVLTGQSNLKAEEMDEPYNDVVSELDFDNQRLLAQYEKLIEEERVRHPPDAVPQLSYRRYDVSLKNAATQVQRASFRKRNLQGSEELSSPMGRNLPQQSSGEMTKELCESLANQPFLMESIQPDPACPAHTEKSENAETFDNNSEEESFAQQASSVYQQMNPASTCCSPKSRKGLPSASVSGRPLSQSSDKKLTVQIKEPNPSNDLKFKKGLVRPLTPHPCSGRDLRYSSDGETEEPEQGPSAGEGILPVGVIIPDREDFSSKVPKLAASLRNSRSGSCASTFTENNPQTRSWEVAKSKHGLDGTVLSKTIVRSPSSKTIESERNVQEYVDIFPRRSNGYLSAFHAVVPSHKATPFSDSNFAAHGNPSAPTMSLSDAPFHLTPIISHPVERVAGTETRRCSSCANIPATISPNNQAEFKSTQTDSCFSRQPFNSSKADQGGGHCDQQRRAFVGFRPQQFSPLCPSQAGVFMLWSQPINDVSHLLPPPCAYWDYVRSHYHHLNPNHHEPSSYHPSSSKDDARGSNVPELRDSTTSPPSSAAKSSTENVSKKVRKKRILRKRGNKGY